MARPLKDGVDYFPLDVMLDEKFDLIEAEFGLIGFAVVVKLYQRVYARGYYCEWTKEVALLFGRSVGINRAGSGGNAVSEIIKAAVRRGIFDKDMFEKYHILTSRGIQKRYFEAVSRRKCVKVRKEYLLVDVAKIVPKAHIVWINADKNPVNENDNPQSKVNKIKQEKSKEKNREKKAVSESANAASDRHPFLSLILNDGTEYPVYEHQIDEWSRLYPAVDVRQELRKMAGWCTANPRRRKTKRGILKFITGWLAREQDRGGIHYGNRAMQCGAGIPAASPPRKPLGTVI